MSLHETIYTLRTQRGLSQLELAEALDVSRQSISKWETGAAVPELDKLVKLSDVFGVTLDELVRGTTQSGETKEEQGQPPQAAVIIERRGMEAHRMIALAVLCVGLFLSVLLLVLTGPRTALLLGVPLVAVGALFLALPRRHLLWGFWVLWLLVLAASRVLTGGTIFSWVISNTVLAVMAPGLLVCLVLLIVATVRRLKR